MSLMAYNDSRSRYFRVGGFNKNLGWSVTILNKKDTQSANYWGTVSNKIIGKHAPP